jgi:hypothetical protein
MKKRMKCIYFLNTYIFGIEWHTNGRKNSGMKNGFKKTEEGAHKKIISCTKITKLKNLRKFLYSLIQSGDTK